MTQVPNMTFTKTNFIGYSIQIRGIGTQAISATTDPAVAVAFNNTPFIRNRFFEQEFYDLQRVEVLRGPQGTLYGRNATAGVVNIISRQAEVHTTRPSCRPTSPTTARTRLEGMVNIPLVEDKVALRIAGAWTKRDGYVTNQITGNPIDGRDLWSTRAVAALRRRPTARRQPDLGTLPGRRRPPALGQAALPYGLTRQRRSLRRIWQTFDDTRSRQFGCYGQALFSQGCVPASLYSPDSFQTPNGLSLPYYPPLARCRRCRSATDVDPYVSTTQSRDLRVIEIDGRPAYQAKNDLGRAAVQLRSDRQPDADLGNGLRPSTSSSRTQDFNRFNTRAGRLRSADGDPRSRRPDVLSRRTASSATRRSAAPTGWSAVDLSTAKSRQFSQELRLASNFDGPFNFSLGANFLRYDTKDKYYVFINTLTHVAGASPISASNDLAPYGCPASPTTGVPADGLSPPDPTQGRNDLRLHLYRPQPDRQPERSGPQLLPQQKPLQADLLCRVRRSLLQHHRQPEADRRPALDRGQEGSAAHPELAAGRPTPSAIPSRRSIEQEWREPTGRLAIDWKPDLSSPTRRCSTPPTPTATRPAAPTRRPRHRAGVRPIEAPRPGLLANSVDAPEDLRAGVRQRL